MNRESILARLDELHGALTKTLSNYNALEGARQECELWLKKLDENDQIKKEGE
jgi:hypothetical protein